MEDLEIVALFLRREETALAETEKKYGKALYAVAQRLLRNREDSWEVVGDVLLDAWNSIPTALSSSPACGKWAFKWKNRLLPLVPADTAFRIKFSKDCGLVRTVQNRSPYPHKKRHSRSYTVFRKEFYAHFYAILFR